MTDTKDIRPIAIYLPQFHPTPENDQWWGKGFTEWTNVVKAKPLFKGHYQPHLPADFGFYDLRVSETFEEQARLAQSYGIHGFCFYHYWFNGKRLLYRPIDQMLQSKKTDFPFMLCWANENWTRRWDGQDREILIKQDYSPDDDKAHIQFLLKNVFSDPRYIHVDGKPFILIYRPGLFPNIKLTLECWRQEAHAFGFTGLYIGYMQSFGFKASPTSLGFDCAVEFQPDFSNLPQTIQPTWTDKIFKHLGFRSSVHYSNRLISYSDYVERMISRKNIEKKFVYKSVTPMWDNSARRKKNAIIFHDSTPEEYRRWLDHVINLTLSDASLHDKFIFINAWNEWAEGNHLEPCQRWGRQYLEATKRILDNA